MTQLDRISRIREIQVIFAFRERIAYAGQTMFLLPDSPWGLLVRAEGSFWDEKMSLGEGETRELLTVCAAIDDVPGIVHHKPMRNLDVIISVGYRVRSHRGTQFRIWATQRLREFIVKGFTMDDERLKNPPGPGQKDYFSVIIPAPMTAIVGGAGGTVYQYSSGTWTSINSAAVNGYNITGLWGDSSGTLWAAASNGTDGAIFKR